jgi:SAM-dependent methyltransferase
MFIKQNRITYITDIGCGDFNIASKILTRNHNVTYSGVDVVEQLIEHHNKNNANEKIKFYCIDTLKEPVPPADLLLVRQVLQHLSNADIQSLINNCFNQFKYILVTEHQVKSELLVKKNIDKETGPNIRAAFGSGVYLNSYPFNCNWEPLLSIEDPENNDCQIITYRILK